MDEKCMTDGEGLEQEGRAWFRDVLAPDALHFLDQTCTANGTPGRRLEHSADLSEYLHTENQLSKLAQSVLPGARAVRAVIFNKSKSENWYIPWHQDRVIAVKQKQDLDGYSSWTDKAGTWHVEPPIEMLEKMFFARIHLDDTDERNGCLEVALRTHELGKIRAEDVGEVVAHAPVEMCRANRGDVLLVKALTLHRSQKAKADTDRRTLRIDYCASALPAPLEWAM
jgi:ectoine hydroxylase-related dioxygenase (phytanoyl-CoA dioxygenase family)